MKEAGLDKSLTGAHQLIGEEAWVDAILPPPTDAISHPDHVSVPPYFVLGGIFPQWFRCLFSLPGAPLVDMSCNKIGVVTDLAFENVVDVVPIVARLWEPTHCCDCKHWSQDSCQDYETEAN